MFDLTDKEKEILNEALAYYLRFYRQYNVDTSLSIRIEGIKEKLRL